MSATKLPALPTPEIRADLWRALTSVEDVCEDIVQAARIRAKHQEEQGLSAETVSYADFGILAATADDLRTFGERLTRLAGNLSEHAHVISDGIPFPEPDERKEADRAQARV